MEHRTFDTLGRFLVDTVVLDIDRRRRSIFLTDSVNAGRIAIGWNVFFENIWAEGTMSERVIEDGLGRTEQIALRERLLLRQKNPGPVGLSESGHLTGSTLRGSESRRAQRDAPRASDGPRQDGTR